MQSPSWMPSNNSNFNVTTSNFWSSGGYRKRKIDVNDFDEKPQHKMFLTEEKMIKDMQTLSLDLSNSTTILPSSQVNKTSSLINFDEDEDENEKNPETQFKLHRLLKDNLRKDDLQDSLINKLYDLERKKLSMQIVPYMPIHPAQLNHNKEKDDENKISSPPVVKKTNDDHLFKRPFAPVPYTVEEPCDNTIKRTPRMKRSYSQSVRYNSNLSVIELKNNTNDYFIPHSQSDYFIVEPVTPALVESRTNHFNSTVPSNNSSIRISEYFDFSLSDYNADDDDDVEMQSVVLADMNDKMDDND